MNANSPSVNPAVVRDSANHKSKLRWQCRRGMRELDVLLLNYLERRFDAAPALEQRIFEQLLELPDPELFGYVTGRQIPADPAIQDLVHRLIAPED
ncbi:MAG: succinate dehydrogenase assembly factor 2 [Candidatus Competibacterales bacterium]